MNMKADRGEMAGGGENDNPLSFIENSPPKRHKGTHNTVQQYLCYGCLEHISLHEQRGKGMGLRKTRMRSSSKGRHLSPL